MSGNATFTMEVSRTSITEAIITVIVMIALSAGVIVECSGAPLPGEGEATAGELRRIAFASALIGCLLPAMVLRRSLS